MPSSRPSAWFEAPGAANVCSDEVTVPSWRLLDLADSRIDLVIDHSPGLVTIGGVRGQPFLGLADDRGITQELVIPPAVAVYGPPRSVRWGEGGLIGVCGPTGLWRQDPSWKTTVPELPTDEEGNAAEWLWVTSGDGELRVVAVYPTDRGRELRIWDDQLRLLSRERSLYLLGDPSQLHISAFAGRVVVCGPVGEAPPASLTMWWSRTYQSPAFDLESAHPLGAGDDGNRPRTRHPRSRLGRGGLFRRRGGWGSSDMGSRGRVEAHSGCHSGPERTVGGPRRGATR